ncbi:biotin/lipoyl-containing protein [Trichlorobacter sp.]|uniref:biotin/lipoyl-containing protein n=1 Tax=Trichlorobacter sp. TaxID=2911007 RepID=UPI002A369A31|nr:biotin/lipoyl-containing protein [Trichlorobacter sp.]MDY0384976.1 biotin/lipoyl-containing protein [Trichlorobacter sp.]
MKMLRITLEGKSYEVGVEVLDDDNDASRSSIASLHPIQQTSQSTVSPAGKPAAGGRMVTSPMAGNVFKCLVKVGDQVAVNQTVIVLDAMKMETPVASSMAGTVQAVLVKEGDAVDEGAALLQIGG